MNLNRNVSQEEGKYYKEETMSNFQAFRVRTWRLRQRVHFILNYMRPELHAWGCVESPGKFQKCLEETEEEEGDCWDVQQECL